MLPAISLLRCLISVGTEHNAAEAQIWWMASADFCDDEHAALPPDSADFQGYRLAHLLLSCFLLGLKEEEGSKILQEKFTSAGSQPSDKQCLACWLVPITSIPPLQVHVIS